jgi:hypothetical protein
LRLANVSPRAGVFPPFEPRVLREDDTERVYIDGYGRTAKRVRVDVIGYGEDLSFKTGPLISPDMFRRFLYFVERLLEALAGSMVAVR